MEHTAGTPHPGEQPNRPAPDDPDVIAGIHVEFGKGTLRLTGRDWIIAAALFAAILVLIPAFADRRDDAAPPAGARVPYAQSEDYWIYRQLFRRATASNQIPVIGDSFVWGEYVPPGETFSSHLNEATGSTRFVNAGLNGAHPLALCGLVEHYAGSLRGGSVLLHCNLLWMSSPERDLRIDSEIPFNHPRLIPQLDPRIAAYQGPASQRLEVVVHRAVPYFGFANHLRSEFWNGQDLPHWTIEHPYANPVQSRPEDPRAEEPRSPAVPWTRRGIEPQDWEWIDLGGSLQWRAWRETAERLRARGNRVFVVVGPFNEHLLTAPSRERYRRMQSEVEAWLKSRDFSYSAPPVLPTDEYGDASHPLSAGYARLAEQLARDAAFRDWLEGN